MTYPRSNRTLFSLIAGLVASAIYTTPATAQFVLAENHFDVGAEGWTVVITPAFGPISPASAVTWQSTNGNPGGYLRHVDPGEGELSYWSAPATYLGDQSAAYGGTLTFDLQQSAVSSQINDIDAYLIGGGLTLVIDFDRTPRVAWTRFQIPLAEGLWHHNTLNGAAATEAELQQVLASLTAVYIRAEFRSGADTDGLDNVVLATKDGCPLSTFDDFTEGWWTIGDASQQQWDALAGNPPGSFVATDLVDGILWHFLAPGKFLGDRRVNMGGTVEFDLFTSSVDADLGDEIITLTGGGSVLRYQANYLPTALQWTHYSVPLLPSPEWTLNDGVTQATDADFLQVLGSLEQFLIRGEYWSGADVGHIDNVHFTFCHVCELPGDVDESGAVDLLDVPTFVDAVIGLPVTDAERRCSDVNQDFRVDGADVPAMVEAILGA